LRNLNELLTGQAYPELAGTSSAEFTAHTLSLPWLSPVLSALFLASAPFLVVCALSHPLSLWERVGVRVARLARKTSDPHPQREGAMTESRGATAALLLLWWLAPLAV